MHKLRQVILDVLYLVHIPSEINDLTGWFMQHRVCDSSSHLKLLNHSIYMHGMNIRRRLSPSHGLAAADEETIFPRLEILSLERAWFPTHIL
jgi:hypothetical protein